MPVVASRLVYHFKLKYNRLTQLLITVVQEKGATTYSVWFFLQNGDNRSRKN